VGDYFNRYIPNTPDDERRMLKRIGVASFEELIADIPQDVRFKGKLDLPKAVDEQSLKRHISALASGNINCEDVACFLGAGIYDHFIPAAVYDIISRSEFYTAYTPYQPEISQGTLQAIFEYQTFLSRLTDMPVVNASMYDGASALAEAALLTVTAGKKKSNVVVSKTVHPEYRETLKTYCRARGIEVREAGYKDGVTDIDSVASLVDEATASVIAQNPNFFGQIEDMSSLSGLAHEKNALLVACVDPITLAVLKTPGEYGADIAVGEGQTLGIDMSFGGPHFGFFASTEALMRKIPGRIVGETVDKDGERGFVLTLQTREQHIRREKASSNICSNQGLCVLTAAAYMSLMGKKGLTEVNEHCAATSHYLYDKLLESKSFQPVFSNNFIKEFVVRSKHRSIEHINTSLFDYGVIGGLDLGKYYPELERCWLVAATEKRTADEIDIFVKEASRVCSED